MLNCTIIYCKNNVQVNATLKYEKLFMYTD